MKFLTWAEVKKIHGVINGIATKNKVVQSILCNFQKNSGYPNFLSENELLYCIGAQTPSGGVSALLNIVGKGVSIRAFEKLGVNQWRDLGFFSPTEIIEHDQGDFVQIRFIKSSK